MQMDSLWILYTKLPLIQGIYWVITGLWITLILSVQNQGYPSVKRGFSAQRVLRLSITGWTTNPEALDILAHWQSPTGYRALQEDAVEAMWA